MLIEEKRCLACEKPVSGRSDKKFCDDYCRNTYHNHENSASNNYVRRINHVLLRNRKILESLLPDSEEMVRTHEDKLIDLGFQFRYHTHVYTTKKGQQYFFCYDYGYLGMENKWYLLVRKRETLAQASRYNA
jgi:hypothetical protein